MTMHEKPAKGKDPRSFATTKIQWTDHTLNVWIGCHKVSPGCKHCYAEVSTPVRVKRAAGLEVWGANAARTETKSWASDLRALARGVVRSASGEPQRVFAQSLSDTFEDRPDLDAVRARFFALVDSWEARSLTFQLLTKRPENILRMVPRAWLDRWPGHVWIGTTVENQEQADRRITDLLHVPAPIRFLSVEPLLEAVDLSAHLLPSRCAGNLETTPIRWIIVGGESGKRARMFKLEWARSIVAQCRAAGVPVFVKQMGSNAHVSPDEIGRGGWGPDATFWQRLPGMTTHQVAFRDSHGGDPLEWPEDLHVREMPGGAP